VAAVAAATEESVMRRITIRALGVAGLLLMAACAAQSGAPAPTTATTGAPAERAPLPASTTGSY